jgi:hypothetical protein
MLGRVLSVFPKLSSRVSNLSTSEPTGWLGVFRTRTANPAVRTRKHEVVPCSIANNPHLIHVAPDTARDKISASISFLSK